MDEETRPSGGEPAGSPATPDNDAAPLAPAPDPWAPPSAASPASPVTPAAREATASSEPAPPPQQPWSRPAEAGQQPWTPAPEPWAPAPEPWTPPAQSPAPTASEPWTPSQTDAWSRHAGTAWTPPSYQAAFDADDRVEPASPAVPTQPVGPRRRSALGGLTAILVVALLAATFASGGTYLALQASGALDRPAAVASTLPPTGQSTSIGSTPSTTPGSGGSAVTGSSDVVAAAARVSPAVVTIISSQQTSSNGQDPFNPAPSPSAGNNGGGLTPTGIGSGFIVASDGWIVTNHHVVEGASALTVQLSNGKTYPATVYGTDTLTDLAIVKIDATGLPTAPLGTSANLQIGEQAIAIGDPLGQYPGTVTAGVVSGLARSIDVSGSSLDDLIQTDAAINPGNSGGPLVNAIGEVIGIDTAVAGSAQGIGFAIPIDIAKPLVKQAMAGQALARPWLGVRYQPLDAGLAAQNTLPVNQGAWITAGQSGQAAVESGGPADKAGLKENDIITAVNGVAVDAAHPLIQLIASYGPGDSVKLTVQRGSQTLELTVVLGTRPANAS
jgi:S1-C subfamily serine protease